MEAVQREVAVVAHMQDSVTVVDTVVEVVRTVAVVMAARKVAAVDIVLSIAHTVAVAAVDLVHYPSGYLLSSMHLRVFSNTCLV